jgi:hypothetical protein
MAETSIQQAVDRIPELSDLPPDHQTFILGILANKTATRAYMQAYPDSTFNAATVSASRLLSDDRIQRVLNTILDARAMQAREIIERQGNLARADMGDIITMEDEPIIDRHGDAIRIDGRIATRQVPHLKANALEDYGYLIKSITPANGGGVRVELYSAQDALNAMERIRRLIQDAPPALNIEQVIVYIPDNTRDATRIIDAISSSPQPAPSGPDRSDIE